MAETIPQGLIMLGSSTLLQRLLRRLQFFSSESCSKENLTKGSEWDQLHYHNISTQARLLEQDVTMEEVKQAVWDFDGFEGPRTRWLYIQFLQKGLFDHEHTKLVLPSDLSRFCHCFFHQRIEPFYTETHLDTPFMNH